jgi:hypothetical protein
LTTSYLTWVTVFPIRLYVPNEPHDLTLLRLFGCSRHLLSFSLHRSTILLMTFCVDYKFDIICCTHDKCQKCNYTHLGTTIFFLVFSSIVQCVNSVYRRYLCIFFPNRIRQFNSDQIHRQNIHLLLLLLFWYIKLFFWYYTFRRYLQTPTHVLRAYYLNFKLTIINQFIS